MHCLVFDFGRILIKRRPHFDFTIFTTRALRCRGQALLFRRLRCFAAIKLGLLSITNSIVVQFCHSIHTNTIKIERTNSCENMVSTRLVADLDIRV